MHEKILLKINIITMTYKIKEDENAWRGIIRCHNIWQNEKQWEYMKWNGGHYMRLLKKKAMMKDEVELLKVGIINKLR